MTKGTTDIFPRRLRYARLMRGLSLEKLSRCLSPSVTRQAINKYEKGLMKPDSRVLLALAGALGVKTDYFFRPFTVGVDKIVFRQKPGFTNKMAVAVKENVRERLERYLEIEQLSGFTTVFTMPRKEVGTIEDAKAFAGEIRCLLGLGLGNDAISNVAEVLEENGIKIFELSDNNDFISLSGFANDKISLIIANGNISTECKRHSMLKELGHLLLDAPTGVTLKTLDTFCNIFASEMLLPSSVLMCKIGCSRQHITLPELTDIQRQFGISVDEIILSLREQGVVTDHRYSVFQKKKRIAPDFRVLIEKSRIKPERLGRFARMVYSALADELISLSKAAVLLDVPIEEVRSNLQLI